MLYCSYRTDFSNKIQTCHACTAFFTTWGGNCMAWPRVIPLKSNTAATPNTETVSSSSSANSSAILPTLNTSIWWCFFWGLWAAPWIKTTCHHPWQSRCLKVRNTLQAARKPVLICVICKHTRKEIHPKQQPQSGILNSYYITCKLNVSDDNEKTLKML